MEGLFEADRSDHKRDACDFIQRNIEWRVVLVVGYGSEAVLLLTWHKTFDKNALLASGNDVALVPLKELSIGEDGAGYDVSGSEMRVHG